MTKVTLHGIPYGGCTPYFIVKQNRGIPYDPIYDSCEKEKEAYKYYYESDEKIEIELSEELKLCGNIMIIF